MTPVRNRRVRLAIARPGGWNAHLMRKLIREHRKALAEMMVHGYGAVMVEGTTVRHVPYRELVA